MSNPSPGWYDDGSGRRQWWDGTQWSGVWEDVANKQAGTLPPPPAANLPASPTPNDDGPGAFGHLLDVAWRERGWKGRVGIVVAALLLASAAAGNSDQSAEDDTASQTSTNEQTETETTVEPATTTTAEDQSQAETPVDADGEGIQLTQLLSGVNVVPAHSPGTPYERDEYQPGGWGDADGDCLNTRHEVLARDSLEPVVLSADGCFVESGRWIDPYTGIEYTSASEVTIDHHIPLAEGHRAGGWAWDLATKEAFANDLDDPDALSVVGPDTNQSKADQAPDSWRPDNRESWCGYATAWLDAKTRWNLSWRQAEVDAVTEMLETCSASSYEFSAFASPATTTTTAPTTTTIVTTPDTPAVVEVLSCSRRSEIVEIANTGGEAISLPGWRLHDEGDKHSTSLSAVTLAPGERLRLLSGPDTTATGTDIKWTSQHVWNNDGDTAFLRDGSGALVAEKRCL